MDELERDDLEVARNTSPEERASQLLAVIRTGFRLKRRMSAATRDTPSAELADHLLLGRGT